MRQISRPVCAAPQSSTGGAGSSASLDLNKLHFDDIAEAKAAHLAQKKMKVQPCKITKPVESRVTVGMEGSDMTIPYVETILSNGDRILRYCVDLNPEVSERPSLRAPWINARQQQGYTTQLEAAQKGIITPEMEYVALRESACFAERLAQAQGQSFEATAAGAGLIAEVKDNNVLILSRQHMACTPEFVRDEIAAGRAVIPANTHHPESEPMIIGKRFLTKVNANIGASAVSSGFSEEIAKLKQSLKFGADTVMDLSTGLDDLGGLRSAMLRASPVPIGTVPMYEALDRAHGDANALNWDIFKSVIIDQAEQGVDYFTIHAGLTASLLPAAAKRLLGIVSRGGGIMASHMMQNDCENLAYEHFDELMEICKKYDVALSLGDGLRPGSLADACDEAQYGELKNIGMLAQRCKENGVQCFIEGPGHVPLHRVEENQRLEDEYCHDAPFYTLGPLVTDIGAGFDHITSAIGGATIAMHGTSMLCYVTPSEHLALPTAEDVRQGLITYKIAAHAADLAKGLERAYNIDNAMGRARADFRWFDQFALTFDPEHAYNVWRSQMSEEDCEHEAAFCSMCGPRFCPIRLNRRLQAKYLSQH